MSNRDKKAVAASNSTTGPGGQNPQGGTDGAFKKILYAAAGSLIGVLLTVLVGDLLIKRNADAYLAEQRKLQESIAEAQRRYDQLEADFSELVSDRRSAARTLNSYIAEGNVAKSASFYDEYMTSIRNWNAKRGSVIARVRNYTECERVRGAPSENAQLVSSVEAAVLIVNRAYEKHSFHKAEESEIPAMLCPDIPVFSGREFDYHNARDRDGGMKSAFEVLRYMHAIMTRSVDGDVFSCVESAKRMFDEEVAGCQGRTKHAWNYVSSAVPECIASTTVAYSPNSLCRDKGFGRSAGIRDERFINVDYWWHIGRQILSVYRGHYLLRVCRENIGTLSGMFGPACPAIVRGLLPSAGNTGAVASM